MNRIINCLMMGLLAAMAGCAGEETQQLSPEAFYRPPLADRSPLPPNDQSGAIPVSGSNHPQPMTPGSPPAAEPADEVISDVVRQVVRPPIPIEEPTTLPSAATRPVAPGVELGTVMTLGSVVAKVNTTPIFANKVIEADAPTLQSMARELSADRFQVAARSDLAHWTDLLINDELEYAEASTALTAADKTLADEVTTRWRLRQITAAGGSLELARRNAAAEGKTFEELVQARHREYLVQLYYQKKFMPMVQVTVTEMRRYYQAHLADFTELAAARFQLIKIDPRQLDPDNLQHGKEMAKDRIQQLRQRALDGEDFATLAKENDRDPSLHAKSGDVGWVQKGAYAFEEVEKAVWKLQPGQISALISDQGCYYLARLEDRKEGHVKKFEEAEVQDQIRQELRARQLRALRQQEQERLVEKAIISKYPDGIQAALDMAMQNYRIWAGK